MQYEARCECGKAHAVGAADAGSSLRCACGRNVEVPPLHLLRTSGGETAVPLLVRVRGLISNGLLPGTTDCACCHRPTKGMTRIGLGCEPQPDEHHATTNEAAGCLLGLLLGSPSHVTEAAAARIVRNESPDFSLVVPLPVCEPCRPTLDDPATIRRALRQIPDYAAILDQYPKALIRRVG
jgi:hypothetical protein